MTVTYNDDDNPKAQKIKAPPPGSPHPALGEYWERIKATRETLNEPRTIDEIVAVRELGWDVDALYKKPLIWFTERNKPKMRWDMMGLLFAACVVLFAAAWLLTFKRHIPPATSETPVPLAVVQSTFESEEVDVLPEPVEVGAYGVLEDGQVFPNARLPARPAEVDTYRVTCYGPPRFPESNLVARYPLTVADGLSLAESMGLDGICAVSPGTPWYDDVVSERLVVLHVEDHGEFLVIDRMAARIRNGVDLYNPFLSSTNQWSHSKEVWVVEDINE